MLCFLQNLSSSSTINNKMFLSTGRGCACWTLVEHVAHLFICQSSSSGWQTGNLQVRLTSQKQETEILCGSRIWSKKHVDRFYTKRALATICTALSGSHFLPNAQPFTSDSYRAIEHSRGTSTSLTSATKKHFKATLPAVPTLFHLSNAHRTVEEVQIPLRGATAHLLPATAPLKMLLLLLRNEYIINLHHLLSQATILSPESQRRLLLWQALPRAERDALRKHFFMKKHSEHKDESSWEWCRVNQYRPNVHLRKEITEKANKGLT